MLEPQGGADKAVRLSQVSEQFESLERAVKRYEELVARANQRFLSVIRPEDTLKEVIGTEKPEPQFVPVADRLRALTRTINGISGRFESMIERAEN